MVLPKHSITLDPSEARVIAPEQGGQEGRHPTHNVKLVMIANEQGWAQCGGHDAAPALAAALGAVNCTMGHTSPAGQPWTAPQGALDFKCPTKLQGMLRQAPQPGGAHAPAACISNGRSPDTAAAMAAAICAGTPPPLRWNAANIYYTDGSCLDTEAGQGIGAAPAGPNGGPQQWAIDPCGAGPTNTINRAELAAILRALQAPEQDTPAPGRVTIATDSACSLFQIRQQL
jgi:hypothetical protein